PKQSDVGSSIDGNLELRECWQPAAYRRLQGHLWVSYETTVDRSIRWLKQKTGTRITKCLCHDMRACDDHAAFGKAADPDGDPPSIEYSHQRGAGGFQGVIHRERPRRT